MKPWRILAVCLIATVLAACSSSNKGGYYKDDGPHARVPANLDSVPDAVPRVEPLASGANRPYTVFGKRYVPDTSGQPYRKRGIASWYGKKFHGQKTSNGETYDMYAMTAAHTTLPLPSYVRVTRVANGRSVVLRVNDRGPFHSDRIIDLSYVAAHKLGIIGKGSDEVIVERIMPDEIRNWQASKPAAPHQPAPQAAAATPTQPPATPLAVATPAATSAATPLAIAAPAAATSTTTPQQSSAAVYLQMGAFREPGNAQSLASRVNSDLPASAAMPAATVQQHADALYRVRIGPYANRTEAVNAALLISNHTGITPSIATP